MNTKTRIIKDCMGNEFEIDDASIHRINGDLPQHYDDISDAKLIPIVKPEYKVKDSTGSEADVNQAIQDLKNGISDIIAINVKCEATHSGENLNSCIYTSDSMEKDCETFMNPYAKPVLKNHNSYDGEPIGRVTAYEFGQSVMTEDRDAISLNLKVTDTDAIIKFLDGRYSTFSISGMSQKIVCQTCGKTIFKDGVFNFCGHYRGQTYKGKKCLWQMSDVSYDEISVVNTPADCYAQVTDITLIKASKEKKKGGLKDMKKTELNKEEKEILDANSITDNSDAAMDSSLADDIDSAIASEGELKDSKPEEKPENEKKVPEETVIKDSAESTPTVEALQAKITELTDSLSKKEEELKAVQDEKESLKAEKETLHTEKETAISDCAIYKNKVVKLATLYKKAVVDSIIDLETTSDSKEDAATEERVNDLMAKKTSELLELKDSLKESQATQRKIVPVENPGLATDSTDHEQKESKPSETSSTVADSFEEVIAKMYK